MSSRNYSSKLLDNAIAEFAKLPGIGAKTAMRLVLHLLNMNLDEVMSFGNTLIELKKEIKYCKFCHNISDHEVCSICENPSRDRTLLCVVESIRDVIAIENTQQFNGVYHVLGGKISPMEGIGPADLTIDPLEKRFENGEIKEVIFALSTTMEGDTTNYYLFKRLNKYPISMSIIARGVSFGDELEYTDELTLGRSIINRTPFEFNI